MKNDILNKAQNDPAYSQIVQLYSGLFDTQDERETFILDVAEEDILLAAECKTSSVEEERNIYLFVSQKAFSQGSNFENADLTSKSIMSLLEIENYDLLNDILKETYRRKPNKVHKETIEFIFKTNQVSLLNQAVETFLGYDKINKMFIGWIATSLNLNSPQEFIKSKNFDMLVEYLINERYVEPLEHLFQKFGSTIFKNFDIKFMIDKFLKNGNRKDIRIAIFLIQACNLNNLYSANILVKQLIDNKTAGSNRVTNKRKKRLIQSIIVANGLEDDFSDVKITKVKTNNREIVKNILPKTIGINNPLTVYYWYECIVTNIIPSRVFVKIENETRPASIYIGELTNQRLANILDFEYNGEKLHIGQKLIAKVINIDEQGRIDLSLKHAQNGK